MVGVEEIFGEEQPEASSRLIGLLRGRTLIWLINQPPHLVSATQLHCFLQSDGSPHPGVEHWRRYNRLLLTTTKVDAKKTCPKKVFQKSALSYRGLQTEG